MPSPSLRLISLCLVACTVLACTSRTTTTTTTTTSDSTKVAVDPLPSWNDGSVKQDIVSFVQRVTHRIKRGEYKQEFALARNGLVSTLPVVPV